MVWPCDGEAPVEAEVFSELIHGMRWRWRDAREEIDVTVGITGEAEKRDVAFLVVGDVFSATTHTDLYLRAKEKGVKVKIVHNILLSY